MAIEWRKGRPYYYRKVWIDGTCRSEYCGLATSDTARLWMTLAQLEKERIEQERMEAQIARNQFAELASAPPDLVELLAEAKRATAATLEAAGYHQHKRGEWRKKRVSKDKDKATSEAT